MATSVRVMTARIAAPASIGPRIVFQVGVRVEGPPDQPVEVELESDTNGKRKTESKRSNTNPGGEVTLYFEVKAPGTGTINLVARVRIGGDLDLVATHVVAVM